MAKFELTYDQYINAIQSELINRLSDICTIKIIRDSCIGYGGLKTLTKEYPQYDSLVINWNDWHYRIDSREIEKSFGEENNINEVVDKIIESAKQEFVKQLLK